MKSTLLPNVLDTGRNALLSSALLAFSLLLSGCARNGKLAHSPDPTGVYTLVTVNGNKVPTTVSHDGAQLQVRSGTFTINPDGTCSSKVVFVPPTGVEATRVVDATYTQSGSELRMQWQRAGQTTGTISGKNFTMNNEGMIFAYQK